jgi:hypothetical protein
MWSPSKYPPSDNICKISASFGNIAGKNFLKDLAVLLSRLSEYLQMLLNKVLLGRILVTRI